MVNKPKQIGTFAEVSVLQVLEPYYPEAKRIVQHGNQDEGDIDSGDGMELLFEVKGGKQCKEPIGPKQLAGWMTETDEERDRAGKTYGALVVQRSGYGRPRAAHWWVYVHIGDLARIVGGHYRPGRFAVTRMELGDFLEILADHDLTADKAWPESGEDEADWQEIPPGTHSVTIIPQGMYAGDEEDSATA